MRLKHFTFSLLVLLISQTCYANSYPIEKCSSPNTEDGVCVSFDICLSLLLKAFNPSNVTLDESYKVENHSCNTGGNTSRICCPVSASRTELNLEHKVQLPDFNICGKQKLDQHIGGSETAIGEFPWIALLNYGIENSIKSHNITCGGTLISEKHVITAAHCVSSQNGKPASVRLGEYNIDTAIDCVGITKEYCANSPIDVQIDKITIHPNFSTSHNNRQADIAIVKLSHSVHFNEFIRPLCLPKNLSPAIIHEIGHLQYLAGWSQTKLGRHNSTKRRASVRIVESDKCEKVYTTLSSRQICTDGGQDDVCTGDSGGPLMVQAIYTKTNEPIWFLTGIESIGCSSCESKEVLGVYTKVYDYLNWIEENID